jgi:hypothetical protein
VLPLAATLEVVSATAAARPYMNLKATSVEALTTLRGKIGPWAVQPGFAIGLTPGYLVPDYRVFIGVGWASRYRDADGDFVDDDRDLCWDEPEDFDGFTDTDGCPDPDNDGDGVPDLVDTCPEIAGDEANVGCPLSKGSAARP